jgi:hypothetical protein
MLINALQGKMIECAAARCAIPSIPAECRISLSLRVRSGVGRESETALVKKNGPLKEREDAPGVTFTTSG